MKNLNLWRSIAISFVLCPLAFSPLEAEVYYKGDWVKIADGVYYFQRKVSSNSGAIGKNPGRVSASQIQELAQL